MTCQQVTENTHLTETLETAHVHHLGQFLNLPEPLRPAVNEVNCLFSTGLF